MKLTKRYRMYLYPNHTETIMKYFVTNLNNLKTKNRSEHLVDWCRRSFEIQAFVFRLSVAKRGACSQAFLAETVQTGDKNLDDFLCMQMSFVMCMRFVFGDDCNDACKLNITWDQAQLERFSYILSNGYRWNWAWYKLLQVCARYGQILALTLIGC